MNLEQVIAVIRSGALYVGYHVDQETEQGRFCFRSTGGGALNAELAAFLTPPAHDEAMELIRMIMLSDTRLCPSGDEHRAEYAYDAERGCFCCPVCATLRRQPWQEDAAAVIHRHWH